MQSDLNLVEASHHVTSELNNSVRTGNTENIVENISSPVITELNLAERSITVVNSLETMGLDTY